MGGGGDVLSSWAVMISQTRVYGYVGDGDDGDDKARHASSKQTPHHRMALIRQTCCPRNTKTKTKAISAPRLAYRLIQLWRMNSTKKSWVEAVRFPKWQVGTLTGAEAAGAEIPHKIIICLFCLSLPLGFPRGQ